MLSFNDRSYAKGQLCIHLCAAAARSHRFEVFAADQILNTQQLKRRTPIPSIDLDVFTVAWNENKGPVSMFFQVLEAEDCESYCGDVAK